MMSCPYRHSVCLYVTFRLTNHFIILHKSRWFDSYDLYIISKWLLKTRDLGFWHIHRSKSMLVNKDFQSWFLIGWQLSRMSVRSHARKSKLTYLELNIFCDSNPGPACISLSTIQWVPYIHYNQPVCIDQPLWRRYQQQNLKPCQKYHLVLQLLRAGIYHETKSYHALRGPLSRQPTTDIACAERDSVRCQVLDGFRRCMVAVMAWMRCLTTWLRRSYDIYLGNLHLRYDEMTIAMKYFLLPWSYIMFIRYTKQHTCNHYTIFTSWRQVNVQYIKKTNW